MHTGGMTRGQRLGRFCMVSLGVGPNGGGRHVRASGSHSGGLRLSGTPASSTLTRATSFTDQPQIRCPGLLCPHPVLPTIGAPGHSLPLPLSHPRLEGRLAEGRAFWSWGGGEARRPGSSAPAPEASSDRAESPPYQQPGGRSIMLRRAGVEGQ